MAKRETTPDEKPDETMHGSAIRRFQRTVGKSGNAGSDPVARANARTSISDARIAAQVASGIPTDRLTRDGQVRPFTDE